MEPTILVSAKSQLRLTRGLQSSIKNYGWFGYKLVGTDSHQQLQTELREANNTMQYIAEDIEEKDDKIEHAYDMTKKDLDAAIDTI